VARGVRWIDLLDASRDELVDESPVELHWSALEQLLAPPPDRATARPRFESHGDYVFGVLVVPVAVPEDDRVFYQEIDFVLTPAVALTVRKTPPDEEPFSIEQVQAACDAHGAPSAGLVLYYLVDDVAERYLSLLDSLNDEIDELESGIESWPNARVRRRLSDLREDILQIRRTLGPTRDAVRRIVDGRIDVGDDELFDRQLELSFADAHDKLLHSVESLDVARDPDLERPRLPPVEDRPGSERGREEAGGGCLTAPAADVHRRGLRPELRAHAGARLAARLWVLVGDHRRDHGRATGLLPLEALDLTSSLR
jgi:magnesium transporter